MESWKEIELGPEFKIATWEAIKGKLRPEIYDENWKVAIDGIYGRFNERFIKPADDIQQRDREESIRRKRRFSEGRGFAIVALDCLLLESLYGYKQGAHTERGGTGPAFERLLTRESPFVGRFPEHLASKFAAAVRNGLLHDGETRDGWLIWQGNDWDDDLVCELGDGRLALYRDSFHAAVKAHLNDYFQKLRSPEGVGWRRVFMKRVEQLCDQSKPRTA